jgi:hypothetical protein
MAIFGGELIWNARIWQIVQGAISIFGVEQRFTLWTLMSTGTCAFQARFPKFNGPPARSQSGNSKPGDEPAFNKLNEEWITHYFHLESERPCSPGRPAIKHSGFRRPDLLTPSRLP